jgi:hypothetical protein
MPAINSAFITPRSRPRPRVSIVSILLARSVIHRRDASLTRKRLFHRHRSFDGQLCERTHSYVASPQMIPSSLRDLAMRDSSTSVDARHGCTNKRESCFSLELPCSGRFVQGCTANQVTSTAFLMALVSGNASLTSGLPAWSCHCVREVQYCERAFSRWFMSDRSDLCRVEPEIRETAVARECRSTIFMTPDPAKASRLSSGRRPFSRVSIRARTGCCAASVHISTIAAGTIIHWRRYAGPLDGDGKGHALDAGVVETGALDVRA